MRSIFEMSVLCQSLVTWRCNAHDYCLLEVSVVNEVVHILFISKSSCFFSFLILQVISKQIVVPHSTT